MSWRVELDVFNGPLDLLLYLIKRDELDILDIPIARITQSYIDYLNALRASAGPEGIDIDLAGDFLVMAATLMEIKSAMLLPRPPAVSEGDAGDPLVDPRAELIRQLLEYKRFREHADALDLQHKTFAERFPRIPVLPDQGDEPPPVDLDEVQIWDLLSAFSKLMGEIGSRSRMHEVTDDDTPLALHMTDLEDRLKRDGAMSLRSAMFGRRTRAEMIGVFLALLELVRQRRVATRIDENSGEVLLASIPTELRVHMAEPVMRDEASASRSRDMEPESCFEKLDGPLKNVLEP